ncbi:GerAB/ArcD/ProY family transporter [Clostridium pasteurianum]|uniref:Spore germination protein n=1 Tax=Clostridium pasteurianum BC1 TaxID=86416 RepID=R4JY12_CLOPA|nr:GerAB/ArcD/ProY family transporter [Clostridium pasteurianum]AGK95168.1 Spore germination protein [Clostridium pasteurianum BC1]
MKEKITAHQFFIIMFLLPYGSAVLFYLSPETKTDIWIGILAYGIIFVIIQMIYISLFNKYPNDSIVTYLPKIYGKFIGYILSIIYIGVRIKIVQEKLRKFLISFRINIRDGGT